MIHQLDTGLLTWKKSDKLDTMIKDLAHAAIDSNDFPEFEGAEVKATGNKVEITIEGGKTYLVSSSRVKVNGVTAYCKGSYETDEDLSAVQSLWEWI